MKRDPSTLVIAVILAVCASTVQGADPVQAVLRQLNRTASSASGMPEDGA